jgi:hypothetical protein
MSSSPWPGFPATPTASPFSSPTAWQFATEPSLDEFDPSQRRHFGGAFESERQADPFEQAEYLEFAFGLHPMEDLVRGEILDPDDNVLAQRTEFLWHLADLLKIWHTQLPPCVCCA